MTISSKNKTVLVLSDVHQDIDRLNKILAARPFDVCCILGDFFDSHVYDREEDFVKTCDFVIGKLDDNRFRFLLGNHDQQYIYKNRYTFCKGVTKEKSDLFDYKFKKLVTKVRSKFEWFFRIDNYLCTHAGLHPHHLPPYTPDLNKGLDDYLIRESEKAFLSIKIDAWHWFYGVGIARKGNDAFGGINWLDFNLEHEKISGLNQIFGHTHQTGIADKSDDLCIDCGLVEWLEINNGKVKYKSIYDL